MLTTSIDDHGFAIFPDVFAINDFSEVVDNPYAILSDHAGAGIRHCLKYETFAKLASDPRMIEIASRILCGSAIPFRATLFDKSVSSNWLVVWHQDTALPLRDRFESPGWGPWSVKDGIHYAHAPASALEEVLALRLHLDESNAENGPLRVIPKSHKLGVLSDDEIRRFADHQSPVECPVPCGGVLAMRPLLIHASSKCKSGARRRVLHIEYAKSLRIADGIELAVA